PVPPSETFEGRALRDGDVVGRGRREVFGQFAHDRHVVRHVLVRDAVALAYAERSADGLSVLKHELARHDVARGEAVAGRHRGINSDDSARRQRDFEAGRGLLLHDREIIVGVNDDCVVAYRRGLRGWTAPHLTLLLHAAAHDAASQGILFGSGQTVSPVLYYAA